MEVWRVIVYMLGALGVASWLVDGRRLVNLTTKDIAVVVLGAAMWPLLLVVLLMSFILQQVINGINAKL